MPQVFENIVCPHCSCACDDLTVTVDGLQVLQVERACDLARPRWLAPDRRDRPVAEIAGKPATHADAVREAARILRAAHLPLVLGLTRSCLEAQRAALALADKLGAVVDTGRGAAGQVAFQEVGVSTATWGEITQRADLVVFFGVDPLVTHPRLVERVVDAPGRKPQLVVVHTGPTGLDRRASLRLSVEPGGEFEALWTLRALVAGVELPNDPRLAPWQDLAARMKSCRTGAVFYGPFAGPAPHRTVEALHRLVTELHRHTRWYACSLAGSVNQAGADNVLAWQTGYPGAVSLARGYPQYGPGEHTAEKLLQRGEADACLLVGNDACGPLSAAAIDVLRGLPTVSVEPAAGDPPFVPRVRLVTSVAGLHHAGETTRLDGLMLPLRAVLPQHYPTEADTLAAIGNAVG